MFFNHVRLHKILTLRGKNILIVASHNSLRAIMKYIEKISDEKIADFEIGYSGLVQYDFDEKLNIKNKI